MLKIALTGNIGSGKSTTAKYFAKLGAIVIDADQIVHELTKKNSAATKKIARHFGRQFLLTSGELNREKLRQTVFAKPKEKIWLENLLHPLVYKKMVATIKKNRRAKILILVIPLLFETKDVRFRTLADRVLLIAASRAKCLARVKKRNKNVPHEIRKILATQMPYKQQQKLADDCLINNGSLARLRTQIRKIYWRYLHLLYARCAA